MGLDIYAGTLTRYYTHDWKSAVQQWAEANGYTFNRVTPEGERIEDEAPQPLEVQAEVCAWRDSLLAALGAEGAVLEPWPEETALPYYTDKPDWDAYGALLLYGACLLYDEPLPEVVEKGWAFAEHPLIRRALDDEAINWSLYSGVTLWLPINEAFTIQGPTPAGEMDVLATTGALAAELARLNELGWQADGETIVSWSDTEGYPADAEIQEGQYVSLGETTLYRTESLAKFAFSMFYQAAVFAQAHRVSVVLDY